MGCQQLLSQEHLLVSSTTVYGTGWGGEYDGDSSAGMIWHVGGSPLTLYLPFTELHVLCAKAFPLFWSKLSTAAGFAPEGTSPWLTMRVIHAQTWVNALLPCWEPGLLLVWFYIFLSRFYFLNACFKCSKMLIDSYLQQFELLNGFNLCISWQFISAGVLSP